MIKSLKESFDITNKFIILATPLILFSLISSLYILFSIGGSILSLIFTTILSILMISAFLSGWFFMIKEAVKNPDNNDPNALIKEFPAGVGEYFLPSLGMFFVYMAISLFFLVISYFIGMKFVGNLGISPQEFSKAMETISGMKEFLISLNPEQLMKLNLWNILFFVSILVSNFLIIFMAPALFFKESNPFKAYFISLKDLFSRKFVKNLFLFFIIFISYFILSILTTIFGINVIIHFLFTLINFYYIVFVSVLVFNFYYSHFVKIGAYIDKRI